MSEMNPRVVDNDAGEITVELAGRELRGWSYANDSERRAKMLAAREYVEGWSDARRSAVSAPVTDGSLKPGDRLSYVLDEGTKIGRITAHTRPIEPARAEPQTASSDDLEDLVARFSKALLAKLKLARANGRSGWEFDDWEEHCQAGLLQHLAKGDPRDVAAYCAFMWHHGWATKAADRQSQAESAPQIDRNAVIEECAKVLDEAAQDWRRIRDPGMANNAASYAKKIRALALTRPERATNPTQEDRK